MGHPFLIPGLWGLYMCNGSLGMRRSLPRGGARVAGAAAVLMAAIGATACSAHYVRSTAPPSEPTLPLASVSRNVVVVSVDGLRPDAIAKYSAPTLQRLMREGSYTLAARTIDPSTTLPSHTSMLTGQPP